MPQNYLAKTPSNFRAEMARYQILRVDVCDVINMNPAFLSELLNDNVPMFEWAANNIGWAVNHLAETRIFEVRTGLMKPVRGRPSRRDIYPLYPDDPEAENRKVPGGF